MQQIAKDMAEIASPRGTREEGGPRQTNLLSVLMSTRIVEICVDLKSSSTSSSWSSPSSSSGSAAGSLIQEPFVSVLLFVINDVVVSKRFLVLDLITCKRIAS